MRFLAKLLGALAIVALFFGVLIWGVQRYVAGRLAPDPVTIASASLQGLREQNRLSAFAARYVAVVTSKQTRLGLTAEKTMIMPGTVRYEVDLAKLGEHDLRWDAKERTLQVVLPPVEVTGPEVDLAQIREYGGGGVLATFSDAERQLAEANRRAGQAELVRQAHEPMPMRLARDATRRAVERSFAMPLKAVGVEATIKVRFADEPSPDGRRWDVSRPWREVYEGR